MLLFINHVALPLKILQELEVEVELLKEDNEQLVTQYEREKVNISKMMLSLFTFEYCGKSFR